MRQTERNESSLSGQGSMIRRLSQTCSTPEILHLIARLMPPGIVSIAFILDWSRWRRQHNLAAAIAHRKIRSNPQL